jgi:uncharacterized surface protein with fasciclin (FAS1) repeats
MLKSKISFYLISFAFLILVGISCKDESANVFTTFEEEQITSHIENNPELYSEFYLLLKASGMADLLNAYGTYTLFAPTNEAVKNYYEKKETSFEQLDQDKIKEIVYNHILSSKLTSIEFPEGIISYASLNEKFLSASYKQEDENSVIYINDVARIIIIDEEMHNGVIHTVDAVIESSDIYLPDVIGNDPRFSLFYQALYETKMTDSLLLVKDENYEQRIVTTVLNTGNDGNRWHTPPFLKYGYTAFVESDSLYALNDIHNLEELKVYAASVYDKMYPEDKQVTDITDRRNSLNRFVSYHLLDRMQAENEFITAIMEKYYVPRTNLYEYMETMCPNTLMEATNKGGKLSFNQQKNGTAIRIISPNHSAMNGIFHEIDRILVYDETVENDVLNKRIRMEVASMMPELVTNKIRLQEYFMWLLPAGYVKNLTFTEGTEVFFKMCGDWQNTGGDEFMLGGKYDFTLRLPPIPAGTYEIRFGYSGGNSARTVAQIYFDGVPCGIPLDMRILGTDPRIGFITDNETDDNGIENDKMMHNRGYMKASNTMYIENFNRTARVTPVCLRRILTTKTFDKTEAHYMRVKSVEDRIAGYQIDYMEFIPVAQLETEERD